jgi:alkyldihydroxyacetonephosphate synthase
MKITREQVLDNLKEMFGENNVVTDHDALLDYDSDNKVYAKAFGVYKAPLPICILNVASTDEISKALKFCNNNEIPVIPRTGASSYEGLLSAISTDTVVVDASAMNKILKIDIDNMMATCQCGVIIQTLENLLNKQGCTTGHCPQSQPAAQMGGLLSTRSIGQFSNLYGGIEDLVCGLEAVLPNGEIVRIRNVPRRAAGPDLRHLFIGSEGALAFITEATVKVFRYYPENFWKACYVVPSFHEGVKAIREIITSGYRPSLVRLYDKSDFDYSFGSVELKEKEAVMFFLAEGPAGLAKATGEAIDQIAKTAGAKYVGTGPVDHWLDHRFDHFYLHKSEKRKQEYREKKAYYGVTEVSASWTEICALYDCIKKNLPQKIDDLILVGGHVSHCQQHGANVYFVYKFKVKSPETFAEEHQAVIDAVCEEALKKETGGCVHHHGMGKMRVKFAEKEHGTSYILMKKIKDMMDPKGIMNPGTLIRKD